MHGLGGELARAEDERSEERAQVAGRHPVVLLAVGHALEEPHQVPEQLVVGLGDEEQKQLQTLHHLVPDRLLLGVHHGNLAKGYRVVVVDVIDGLFIFTVGQISKLNKDRLAGDKF